MAILVLIIGKSGSGKSASMRNFPPDKLQLVNVIGKPLPFRNSFKDAVVTDSYYDVAAILRDSPKPSIVIDDAGYLITDAFMRGHSSGGGGNSIFQLYNSLADSFWKLIEFARIRSNDKIIYFIMHEDKSDSGDIKPKTIGKLLDEKVCIEGMFTIVLRSMKKNGNYYFATTSDGYDVTKTPIGLFDAEYIDNDLYTVDNAIREYYGIAENENKGE